MIEAVEPEFEDLVQAATPELLYQGCRWAEGPAYIAAGRCLVWSDIPKDRMLRRDETTGLVSVFRAPCGHSNGNTIDTQGRLVTCEHGGRRVSRTEHDGSVKTLVDRFEGRKLNSPNDVVFARDGSIWFTDPTYGIDSDYEGHRAESEIGASNVYRLDPSGTLKVVADDFEKPNGIAFSPDGARLYVSDTGATHRPDGPRHIRVFDVHSDGTLHNGKIFAKLDDGLFDGLRLDEDRRVWTSAGTAVHCYGAQGALLGRIQLPAKVANVCFGGPNRDRLFICATSAVYFVDVKVRGA